MAIKSRPCKLCQSIYHTAAFCSKAPRKPIKRSVIKPSFKKAKVPIKKKPKAKTALKKRLEKLVKDYVKVRDEYTCQRCGLVVEGSNCHASHVIPVSRSGYLQFDPMNMKVLCYHDHINWWHKHPVEAGKWFTDTFPERWEYLRNLHIQRLKPMNEAQLIERIEHYKSLIK